MRQMVMLGSRVAVVCACMAMAVAGCSSGGADVVAGAEADTCAADPGSVIDLDSEPDWREHADYRPWTDADGCLLRIDILAERSGPEHCGWEDAEVLIAGAPLGEPYKSSSDTVEFVRDPEGVFEQPGLADAFVADGDLPEGAVDSGFRRDGIRLWHVPGDQSQVWLVSEISVEQWPAGDPPVCS